MLHVLKCRRRRQRNPKKKTITIRNEGIVVGLGVGITRDCTLIMTAQYFKKKREFVEALSVAGSGLAPNFNLLSSNKIVLFFFFLNFIISLTFNLQVWVFV